MRQIESDPIRIPQHYFELFVILYDVTKYGMREYSVIGTDQINQRTCPIAKKKRDEQSVLLLNEQTAIIKTSEWSNWMEESDSRISAFLWDFPCKVLCEEIAKRFRGIFKPCLSTFTLWKIEGLSFVIRYGFV